MATQPVLPKSKPSVPETIVENDVGANEAEETTKEPVPLRPNLNVPETTVEEDVNTNAERQLLSPDVPQKIVGKDGAEMVLIPAGDFQMGSNHRSSEQPVHTVYVDAFYMDVYEVTVGQYNRFVRATGHRAPSNPGKFSLTDQHPIVNVSWHDAMAYAKWAGKRLPTEAEWEKAARGGLEGQKYPWGNAPPDGTQCNFADKNLSRVWDPESRVETSGKLFRAGDDPSDKGSDDSYTYAAPVGSYPPNGYGLYDMAGNVSEWCFDAYDENFYASSPRENPIASIIIRDVENSRTTINELRASRGGSWISPAWVVQVSSRTGGARSTGMWTTNGFRCVQSAKP